MPFIQNQKDATCLRCFARAIVPLAIMAASLASGCIDSNSGKPKQPPPGDFARPLAAEPSQPKFTLSNLRISKGVLEKTDTFEVDWQFESDVNSLYGKGTLSIIVRPSNGEPMKMSFDAFDIINKKATQGTSAGYVHQEFQPGIKEQDDDVLSDGCEIYFGIIDRSGRVYKVSNSVIHGDVSPAEPVAEKADAAEPEN